jgi:hypothetical protein
MYIKPKRLLFETNPDVGMSRRSVQTPQSHKMGSQKQIGFSLKPGRCAPCITPPPRHCHHTRRDAAMPQGRPAIPPASPIRVTCVCISACAAAPAPAAPRLPAGRQGPAGKGGRGCCEQNYELSLIPHLIPGTPPLYHERASA